MKNISYLEMVSELLNQSDFSEFEKTYRNPVKKSIKIISNRGFKNSKSDLHDDVLSCISSQRDLSEPEFSFQWTKYSDVLFATRKPWLKSASLWSHFLHQAWLIYVQEMAASLSVQMLDIQPWDCVLDMCAAPWWKSVQIYDKRAWFLVANEIDSGRKKALISNLQRCWIRNATVIQQDGCTLWDKLPEFFDKVLVDAPCSWEWMQYKSDKKVRKRDELKSTKLSNLQIQLLISGLKALKVWWELIYSTCTTNILENEYVVSTVLEQYSDSVELINVPLDEKSDWICSWRWNEILSYENAKKVARLWPHIHQTGGFFIAKFKKIWTISSLKNLKDLKDTSPNSDWKNMIREKLSERGISPNSEIDFFTSKFSVNLAPKWFPNSHFTHLFPEIEIWLPIFKIVVDNRQNSKKLIPLKGIAQVFGHLATKNVIDITDEQLQSLMEKKDLFDDRLVDFEWKFLLLTRNWVGVWAVSVQNWIGKNKCL